MPTEILAPGTSIAASSDIVVASGDTLTLGLYRADNDHLIFPRAHPNYDGDFLFPDGSSFLLMPTQGTSDPIPGGDDITLKRKDPLGIYNPTGIVLNGGNRDTIVGPGTWQVSRDKVTSVLIGVQKD